MPIYEYACQDCGTKFEKLMRRASDEIECPECRGKKLAQQWSTFAARANGVPKDAAPMGGCPAGMCQTPGLCGRN